MRNSLLYIVLLLCMAGCRTQTGYTVNDTVYIETLHRDTVIRFAADSASVQALLQCDSFGNVLLQRLAFEQGRNVTVQANIVASSKQDKPVTTFLVDCKQDSLQKEVDLLTTKIRETHKEVQTIEVHKLNGWQAFIQVSGYLAWVFVILSITLSIILKVKGIL